MSQKRFFVTGTGTGVGKTFVTCAIASLAKQRGLQVVAHKPIETGCELVEGGRVGADQKLLRLASSSWLHDRTDEVAVGTYQLAAALAPSVAARQENRTLDMQRIGETLERAEQTPSGGRVDVLLVEGAGGWRVPITDQHEMRDLARLVGGEILVVGLATLGTINHSLLTVEAVEREGHSIAALVLSNRPDDDEAMVRSNVEEIQKRWSGRVLQISELGQVLHVERGQTRETPQTVA